MESVNPSILEKASVMVEGKWNVTIVLEMLDRIKTFLAYTF